jgi:dUTPase
LPTADDRESEETVKQHTRLVQICHPSLKPINVVLLDDETKLTVTTRNGGFGSTGIVGEILG